MYVRVGEGGIYIWLRTHIISISLSTYALRSLSLLSEPSKYSFPLLHFLRLICVRLLTHHVRGRSCCCWGWIQKLLACSNILWCVYLGDKSSFSRKFFIRFHKKLSCFLVQRAFGERSNEKATYNLKNMPYGPLLRIPISLQCIDADFAFGGDIWVENLGGKVSFWRTHREFRGECEVEVKHRIGIRCIWWTFDACFYGCHVTLGWCLHCYSFRRLFYHTHHLAHQRHGYFRIHHVLGVAILSVLGKHGARMVVVFVVVIVEVKSLQKETKKLFFWVSMWRPKYI